MSICVFCEILRGGAPASVVYEDEATLAFANLRQPTWPRGGDILVIPRGHVEQVDELPGEIAAGLMRTVVRVSGAMRATLRPEGLSVWSSTGQAAGQEVPHVHLHVLARFAGDDLLRVYPRKPDLPDRQGLDALADRVRSGLGRTVVPRPDSPGGGRSALCGEDQV